MSYPEAEILENISMIELIKLAQKKINAIESKLKEVNDTVGTHQAKKVLLDEEIKKKLDEYDTLYTALLMVGGATAWYLKKQLPVALRL